MQNVTSEHRVEKKAGEGVAVATVPPGKLPVLSFVQKAIVALRKNDGESLGIHTVFSGFNDAFRCYYGPGADPLAAVAKLVEQGLIEKRVARGGAVIYLPGGLSKSGNSGEGALEKMGIDVKEHG